MHLLCGRGGQIEILWMTKEGLEFLLSLTSKDKRLRYKVKKQIEKHTKKEKM